MTPGSWAHITGTGDDGVVVDRPCVLRAVIVGTGAASETLAVHDAADVADADAANLVSTIPLDDPTSIGFGCQLGRGLVAIVSGGAPDITIVWG